MKYLALTLMLFLLLGCSATREHPSSQPQQVQQRPPATEPAPAPWPPKQNTVMPLADLPEGLRQSILYGIKSPDGKWVAHQTPSTGPDLWVANENAARLIDTGLPPYLELLWSPGSHLLYRDMQDRWLDVDPTTGLVETFLPGILQGKNVGTLQFSPDGQRLLYTVGVPYGTPADHSPQTTFVTDSRGEQTATVGVDVTAHWTERGEWTVVPLGPIPFGRGWKMFPDSLKPPVQLGANVRSAASVKYRVSTLGQHAVTTDLPMRQVAPNEWRYTWENPPMEPVQMEVFIEVRAGAPQDAGDRTEDGKRWLVCGPNQISP